jgi:transposase
MIFQSNWNRKSTMSANTFVISRAFANITTEFVTETLQELNLGVIRRVDKFCPEGSEFSKFFIHMESWSEEGEPVHARLIAIAAKQLAGEVSEGVKIIYDDYRPKPYYWVIYAAKTDEERQAETDKRLKAPKVRIVL